MPSIEDLLGKKKPGAKAAPGDESTQDKFAKKMEEIKIKEKEKEAAGKAAGLGVPYIDLFGFPIAPEALQLLPREQAKRLKTIVFLFAGEEVRMGALDPTDPALEEIKFQVQERAHSKAPRMYLISERSFAVAEKLYDALPEFKEVVKGVQITEAELNDFEALIKTPKDLNEHVQKVSTTDFVTLVIAAALRSGVSDIHIEAEEKEIMIRFRIDGVLQRVAGVPASFWPRIISRIKLLSGLKLNITTAPQDGRFTIFLTNDKVDVRVSTLPTAYGESVVMRLLKSSAAGLQYEQLGIRGKAGEQLTREVERPNGMIVTTGPTGSGKTTTLYAILNKLNDGETKIITLEDPIEYKLAGINQSQIDKSKDYTFDKGLHSILRQDPDVVMVGELRDLETAEVAIQAALTGHLVVSTIHTNSAAGAVPRFMSMGIKPFLLAPALNAIIGQRLVRKIHQDCKIEETLAPKKLERVKKIISEISPDSGYKVDVKNMKFYKGKGCPVCADTGYKGRIGIYEILTMSPEIEKVILGGQVSEYDMQAIAIKQGMVTMVQDGILKALDGITTVDEVFNVAE